MTIEREKAKIDECIALLNLSEKELGEKYNKDASNSEKINTFRYTRIESILSDLLKSN